MRLCIPTSWDNDFLDRLAAMQTPDSRVHELFGSLAVSVIGSGREAFIVPDVERDAVREHIALAHKHGFRFNYLMNASTMGGIEFTPQGRADLVRYIEWVADIGADAITVTIPFVLELIGDVAPHIERVVSTIAHVDSLAQAAFWKGMGADRVTLSLMINRDFSVLKSLRKSSGLDLEVLANELCLYMCPYRSYHYDLMSQGSQPGACAPGTYPGLCCSLDRMKDPAEFLKARFIRPEDVRLYENIGIDLIKIAGRGRSTETLLQIAGAYFGRRWDGNLLDISDISMYDAPGVDRAKIYIDNRKLDGFVETMATIDCRRCCGASCQMCGDVASKAVRIEGLEEYKDELEKARGALVTTGAKPSIVNKYKSPTPRDLPEDPPETKD